MLQVLKLWAFSLECSPPVFFSLKRMAGEWLHRADGAQAGYITPAFSNLECSVETVRYQNTHDVEDNGIDHDVTVLHTM